jgi:hypothetical protein
VRSGGRGRGSHLGERGRRILLVLILLLEFDGGGVGIVESIIDLRSPDALATHASANIRGRGCGGYPPVVTVGLDAEVVSLCDGIVADVEGRSG